MSSYARAMAVGSLARFALLACLLANLAARSAGEVGTVLVAKRDLAVLESPRNGLFCQHGAELGRLPKDSRITTYTSVKSFCGLFVAIEYVKFEYETKAGTKVTAYVRRKETNGTDRFSLQALQEAP
jgi:hypothetical protein